MELDLDLSFGDVGFDTGEMDLGNFDLSASLDVELETRIVKLAYYRTVPDRMIKAEHASDLVKSIKLERGMRIHAVVSGNFIFSHFIRALLMDNNIKAKRMVISTLSMSQDCIEALRDVCDLGYCDKLDLIVSAYFYSHERHALVKYLYESLDNDDSTADFQLAVAGTHCKTVQIETAGGAKIVIHGSANLRSSGCLEQFSIEENADLHDFHNSYADAILDVYSTIKKEVRRKKLWEVMNG
jgi:hypothetical protein